MKRDVMKRDVMKRNVMTRNAALCWMLGALAPMTACAMSDAADDAPEDVPDGVSAGDAPESTPDLAPAVVTVRLADTVTSAPGATGSGFGDSSHAVNGVRGTGTASGSTDVFALGYGLNTNDRIVVTWSNGTLQNGAGNDLVVFENPFLFADGTFMDLIVVEVSLDGVNFRSIAHDYTSTTPATYSRNPALWPGFAGRTPVLLNADSNVVDPFNQAAAGGDQFDLSNVVGSDAVATAIRANGARYVRLISASTQVDPHTGAVYPHDVFANGPDIDGVYGRYVAPL